jgi:hypothetical protein
VHMGSPTARGSSSASHCAGRMLLSDQENGVSTSEFDPFIAVGTEITPRPPHRSERALLTHSVLTLSV